MYSYKRVWIILLIGPFAWACIHNQIKLNEKLRSLGSRKMAQLIFGSSLYQQRKDQMSQKNWKTSHLAMHKLINFYTF